MGNLPGEGARGTRPADHPQGRASARRPPGHGGGGAAALCDAKCDTRSGRRGRKVERRSPQSAVRGRPRRAAVGVHVAGAARPPPAGGWARGASGGGRGQGGGVDT